MSAPREANFFPLMPTPLLPPPGSQIYLTTTPSEVAKPTPQAASRYPSQVLDPVHTYLTTTIKQYEFVNNFFCSWYFRVAMCFQRYDPRATYFDWLIQQIDECGVKDRLLGRALPYRDMKEHMEHKQEKLFLEHYYVVFIAGLVGGTLAIVAFIAEITARVRPGLQK